MTTELSGDVLTVAEAAKLLKVSAVTIKRYLKQGRLAGYHVGSRAVRLRRSDVLRLLTPKTREEVTAVKEAELSPGQQAIAPLGEQAVQRGLQALEQSQRLAEQMLARRHGQPLSSSWEDFRQARTERAERR